MTAIQQSVEILQQCREQLELCTQTPLNIEVYREELIHECNIAIDLWNELKSSERRIIELESNTKTTKDMPNKMEYSKAANELLVVKKKSKELSSQINKEISVSAIMVKNTKRVKIELDRLDDILRIAQLELQLPSSESTTTTTTTGNMTPSLQAELEAVPAQLLREQLITQNKIINQALEEVRYTLYHEKEDHRELVADIQFEIKTIRDNLDSMANGTYPPAVELEARQIDRRRNQTNINNNQRRSIQNEIDLLKARIYEDGKVQDANIFTLQNEQLVLEQRLADMIQYNTTSMHDVETILSNLHHEQSNITVVLQQLAIRVAEEEEEEKAHAELERARLAELEYEKSIDEKEYFAALWIQLRWKAYCKRKAMKQKNEKKSKKGRGVGGGSKK